VELIVLLLTGGLAGWIAGTLVRGAGCGLVINILIGVVGGLLGGKALSLLGIGPEGWFLELATAVAGAALLLATVDVVRRRIG
jgi:uncharacterized membrane protein YeaQ/YmgE (transglycosylase-associated protein family)